MHGFQRPITLISALTSIRDRSFLLPAIQRRFVWSAEKVEALFDSLMRGYPISSFMFWEIRDAQVKNTVRFYDFLQHYREHFGERNSEVVTRGHKDFFAVIDGQQRLTALYLGVFGSYAYKLPRVWLKDTEENLPTRHLYVNVRERRFDDDEQGMTYDFRFRSRKEVPANSSPSPWFKVADIIDFDTADKLDGFIDENPQFDKEARRTLRRLQAVVHQDETINFYVEEDQDIERVLDIFIRTNSGGVPLGYSDLLMAYTTAQWARDARTEFDHLVDGVFAHGFAISKDFILKTCLALFSGDVRFRLANLNSTVIDAAERNWERVATAVVATFEFLADLGFHERNLQAKVPVIPIVLYVYRREIEAEFARPQSYLREKAAIRTWICMTILKGVFRNQPDQLLNQLRGLVDQGASASTPHFPLTEIRAAYHGSASRNLSFDDAFVNEMMTTRIDDPAAFPLLTLLYSHLDYSRQRIDIDHLHPEDAIVKIREMPVDQRPSDWAYIVDPANWNSVANLQPLNESLNRSKQAQSLAAWVKKQKIDRVAYLLPPDVDLDIGSFRAFIEARRVLLAKRLAEVVGDVESPGANR